MRFCLNPNCASLTTKENLFCFRHLPQDEQIMEMLATALSDIETLEGAYTSLQENYKEVHKRLDEFEEMLR